MPKAKPLSKEMIVEAMQYTKSIHAAARYLKCSFHHIKRYMKAYTDEETGLSLFELHKNQSGKGIPKHLSFNSKYSKWTAEDIANGRIDPSSFKPSKLKHALVESGYIKEQCYMCGFEGKREVDGKSPLLLHYLDGDSNNVKDGNAQLLCYNCHFINVGKIYNDYDLEQLESHQTKFKKSKNFDVELDEYSKKRLAELSGEKPPLPEDPYALVSRKKK